MALVVIECISKPDHTLISLTKNFILFAFRVCSILNKDGNCIWKNLHPNSTFSMRPIAIVALQESDENVRFIMDSVINTETSIIEETGIDDTRGKAQVEIIRSQFDTKKSQLLSRSGGADCQLCTATFAQADDFDLARDGFPINRFIHDAKIFFEEVGEEQFRTLSSDQRFNLTNLPTSDKDIICFSITCILKNFQ